jgi:hypothetical protein
MCGQEGHTSVIELEPASHDDNDIAKDDPDAVRLMIDYFYLSDYDPEVITRSSSTIAADGSGAEIGPCEDFRSEAVKHDTGTEVELAQADDIQLGPETPNTDPTRDQPDAPTLPVRKKKGKGKLKGSNVDWSLSLSQPGIEEPKSLPTKKLLTIHAMMYSIAAKYGVEPLMETAVVKFKSTANSKWDTHDLIASVPIVYNQNAAQKNDMRDILEVMILEHAFRLVLEKGFREAIEQVDGLAIRLFERLGAMSRHQKVCRRCGAAYVSTCLLGGCKPDPFRGYSHDCDLKGPCRDCKRSTQRY